MTKTKRITAILLAMLLLLSTIAMVACVPTFSVTKGNTVNGTFKLTIDGKQAQIAKQGATIEVIPSPSQNYEVDRVYYTYAGSTDETDVTKTDGKYTFEMPASNITVYVTFKTIEIIPQPTKYTLTKSSAQNGTYTVTADNIQVTDTLSVEEGAEIAIIPTADSGYMVKEVYYTTQDDSKTVLTASDTKYTFAMPASNITVYVSFIKVTSTDDFTFELSEDSTYYSVTGYSGTDTEIAIPSTYNNLPVKEIGLLAFSQNYDLQSVFIPNSITKIGDYAFDSCTSLSNVIFEQNSQLDTIGMYGFCSIAITQITIPASVTEIGFVAFDSCTSLQTVTFEEGSKLKTINTQAFAATAITSIIIPASVTYIDAFNKCYELETVIFEQGSKLQTIGSATFVECTNLKSIVIPASVTTIIADDNYPDPFHNCFSLSTIYYGGDLSSWVTLANRPTTGTVYFYSQSQQAGDYWHYDANGLPTKWN